MVGLIWATLLVATASSELPHVQINPLLVLVPSACTIKALLCWINAQLYFRTMHWKIAEMFPQSFFF
jgi:hypothetical protein